MTLGTVMVAVAWVLEENLELRLGTEAEDSACVLL